MKRPAATPAVASEGAGTSRGTVRGLLLASHAGPTVVVTALSAGLLAGVGAPPATFALAVAAVAAGQLSVGWSNDWADASRDRVVGRTDKPVVRGLVTARTVGAAAAVAGAACVVLSLATGWRPGLLHVAAVASAWSYNLALKRTPWSWLPYAVSFGLLPAFLVLALPGGPRVAGWAVAAAALLGAGAHVANVLPDLEDDAATGVRGLPHRLGRRASSVLAPAVLVTAVLVVVLGPQQPPSAGQVAAATVAVLLAAVAGVVAVARHRSRLPFALSMAVAALCVGLLVAAGPDLVGA